MPTRFDLRLLLAVALFSLLGGAANNALRAQPIPWLGSPKVMADPWDLEQEPHATGARKGVSYALTQAKNESTAIALGALCVVAISLAWRRLGKPRWGEILESWFRIGMAAIFLAACWYKLRNPGDFARAIAQYRMLPPQLVDGFALFLPALELAVALGLLFTRWTREFYLLLSLLWVLFIIALTQALARRLGITCGCFSIADIPSGVGETWFSLLRDLVLLVPTLWLALRAPRRYLWESASG